MQPQRIDRLTKQLESRVIGLLFGEVDDETCRRAAQRVSQAFRQAMEPSMVSAPGAGWTFDEIMAREG